MKNTKGITLVVLVITIVVIIILAALSINLAFGDNGIISSANKAKMLQQSQEGKQELETEILNLQINKIKEGKILTLEEVADFFDLSDKIQSIQDNGDETYTIVNNNNYEYLMYEENEKICIETNGKANGEPSPTITVTQLPTEGVADEKIKVKIEASVKLTQKTTNVEKIVNITTGEEYSYNEGGIICEVDANGTYIFEAQTNTGKSKRAKITVNLSKGDPIEITSSVSTPRNTLKTGEQNGIQTGPIQITIKYGEIDYTNSDKYQYKIGSTEWKSTTNKVETIEVSENTTIFVRYFDGKNSASTNTYDIHNVDNEKPNEFTATAQITFTTFELFGTTTDIVTEGYDGDTTLTYKYSIDGNNWQTSSKFTGLTSGQSYTGIIKAIDLAGNESIATVTETLYKSVESISFANSSETINLNSTKTLTSTIKPEDAYNKSVTWESSDTTVATVSSSGVVTTKAVGTATITCTAADGSGVYGTCKIISTKTYTYATTGATYTESTVNDYSYTGSYQTVTLSPGTYKLEVWGAQGGTANASTAVGGNGGYSVGILTLETSATVYVYVGGAGTSATGTTTAQGGYNGGGSGYTGSSNSGYVASGGGSTDIRIGSTSLYSRIIVAGGGRRLWNVEFSNLCYKWRSRRRYERNKFS